MGGATLLPSAGRLSGVEAKGASEVSVVVDVVLNISLGWGVHGARENQALGSHTVLVDSNLKSLL